MKTYSYSRLKLFLECARKFRYQYQDGWVPSFDGVPLPMGKATHAGIEALAKGASSPEATDVAVQVLYEGMPDEVGDKDEEKFRIAEHQLRAILRDYPKWGEGVEIIGVEKEVVAPMPYGRAFKGILDLIVRINGQLYVWDTKTTGDPIERAAKANRLRLQYPGYAVLGEYWAREAPEAARTAADAAADDERADGPTRVRAIAGVVVDLIHKPRVYVRKDGSLTPNIKPAFHRESINVDAARRRDFVAWFNHVAFLIELNESAGKEPIKDMGDMVEGSIVPGVWPMNDGSCSKWGRVCPYFECCRNPERAVQLMEVSDDFKRDDRESRGGDDAEGG